MGEDASASVTGRAGEQFEHRVQYETPAFRDTNGFQPIHRPGGQDDAFSVIQRQAERIAMLEARLSRLEPRSVSTDNHLLGQSVTELVTSGRLDSHMRLDTQDNPRAPDTVPIGGEDAFVFRGKGFKTQFYGPSSPMSAILNSHLILKFVSTFHGLPLLCLGPVTVLDFLLQFLPLLDKKQKRVLSAFTL